MDLADRIVEANNRQEVANRTTDELGLELPLEECQNPNKYTEYLCARILALHPTLHKRHFPPDLYEHHTLIHKSAADIARLARVSKTPKAAEVEYIYQRLLEVVPSLNDNLLEICPGVLWDVSAGKIIELDQSKYFTV